MNRYNFQIGDYVLYEGVHHKICSIGASTVLIGNTMNEEHILPYSAVVPIEITEEWISRNGFIPDPIGTFDDFKTWVSKDHRLQISNLSNTIYGGFNAEVKMYKSHLDNDYYESIGSLDVQYVHQIQHLCRDCMYEFEPKF